MKSAQSGGSRTTTTGRSVEGGRRRVLAGLAAATIAPAAACRRASRIAGSVDEALDETADALEQGAASCDPAAKWIVPAATRSDYREALRYDFAQSFTNWASSAPKVKLAAFASGVIAVLIAKGNGASPPNLTKDHVFMGSAIVKGSKLCPVSRGRFCANATFASLPEALKALLA